MADPYILCRVAPELADHVRELLADAGVTATAVEAPDQRMLIQVDHSDVERAQAVIGLVLPDLLATGGPAGEAAVRLPTESGSGDSLSDRLVRTETADPADVTGSDEPGSRAGYADPLAEPDPADNEFVPPHPPPLQRPRDRVARAAWLGVIGGPILLVAVVVLSLPGFWTSVGLIAFFGGFAALVYRMDDRRRSAHGDDDGAVV